MKSYVADVVIFGGGIAGLWTLAQLRRLGYAAILLEAKALGGVQTLCSQGIIHGGTKYALSGKMTKATQSMGEMPGIWQDCLDGRGEIDLSRVKVLAEHQFLWSTQSLLSKMTGFFAGKAMRSRMLSLKPEDFPSVFRHADFKGSLYQLDEPVLDVGSLSDELYRQFSDYCYLIDEETIKFSPRADAYVMTLNKGAVKLTASRLVLTAGRGNEALLKKLGRDKPKMQTRPLHMVMLKGDLPMMFAHCLGVSANPRLTITSYQQISGEVIWYVGGQPAEEGIHLSKDELIMKTLLELKAVIPWVDLSDVDCATKRIMRAEIQRPNNKRPDSAFVQSDDCVMTVWPTKLAFAPMVATQIIDALYDEGVEPMNTPTPSILELERPPKAKLPWQQVLAWN